MGMVNAVVPHADLEATALDWGRKINAKSPTAQRMLKFAFNLIDDGLVGQQVFAGEATRLAYMTDEAVEGRDAFLEKRAPTGPHTPTCSSAFQGVAWSGSACREMPRYRTTAPSGCSMLSSAAVWAGRAVGEVITRP